MVVREHLTVGGDDHPGALVLFPVGLDVDGDHGVDHLVHQLRDGDIAAEDGCPGRRAALVDGHVGAAVAVAVVVRQGRDSGTDGASDEGRHDRHGQPGPQLARRAAARLPEASRRGRRRRPRGVREGDRRRGGRGGRSGVGGRRCPRGGRGRRVRRACAGRREAVRPAGWADVPCAARALARWPRRDADGGSASPGSTGVGSRPRREARGASGVPAVGSDPGCSVSSLMWILLKGT